MTNYTSEFKTRIIEDYADQTKTCWASDSGKPVSECWCAQCNEARTLRPLFIEIADLERTLAQTERFVVAANDTIYKAGAIIQNAIGENDISSDELQEPFWIDLCGALGVETTDEVEITVTFTYSGSVIVPKGTDVSELSFGNDWSITASLNGDDVGDITIDDTDVTCDY